MEAVLLKSNSDSDLDFIIELARKLDIKIAKINSSEFEDVIETEVKKKETKHNFLDSKGIWKNRVIDSKQSRNDSWKIQE